MNGKHMMPGMPPEGTLKGKKKGKKLMVRGPAMQGMMEDNQPIKVSRATTRAMRAKGK